MGIRRNQLYKWKEQVNALGEQAFPGKGRVIPSCQKVMILLPLR
ncbi:MAG: hypothetical protein KUG71_13315 [Porticoccaceae bacterium]|nr:hypothetical protein [Porticoccaceae bacterium]